MDQAAVLDHQFVVAAYIVTWVLQGGYLLWLGVRWRAEKRTAAQRSPHSR
jgi:threonine/homoserine/homoserine lactone efflux protein